MFKKVFIVLHSSSIGGAEVRFSQVWQRLSATYPNIYLVLSERLETLLKARGLLDCSENNIIVLKGPRLRNYIIPLVKLSLLNIGSLFHYPLVSVGFIHSLLASRLVQSYTNNSLFKGEHDQTKIRFLVALNFLFARRLDILDPSVFEKFRQWKLLNRKISKTELSFVDYAKFRPSDIRQNIIVFSGRMTSNANKGLRRLIEQMPEIIERLDRNLSESYRFIFMGDGSLVESIEMEFTNNPRLKDRIQVFYSNHPEKILSTSKVFLSLQSPTNYPSQSLLEALSCGNLVVMTDDDQSRIMATNDIAEFIPHRWSVEEISSALIRLCKLDSKAFSEKS
ncbi:MAG: hypothetical protein COV44_11170, partial [Deltaproteobacteria bacterium CG11_big_fil_rev_8_21_14_0_20_45_16]